MSVPVFKNATCKGSYILGSACGHCERCAWERSQMAAPKLSPAPFEQWAASHQYNVAPAVFPAADRVYADRHTQAAYEGWCAGMAAASKDIMRSMVEGLSPEQLASAGIVWWPASALRLFRVNARFHIVGLVR